MTKETAMKILKELHSKSLFAERTALETLIHELKESEDERIRKALVRFHKSTIDIDGIKGADILAWLERQGQTFTKKDVDDAYLKGIIDAKNELEKQGEQKTAVTDFNAKDWYVSKVDGKIHDMTYNPADKVEPRFKVGDWVTDGQITCLITDIIEDRYIVDTKYSKRSAILFNNESRYHLWTIQDAKDGDVLACGDKVTDCPFIFHNLTEELNPRSYCGVSMSQHFQDNDENGGFWCHSDEVRPATKEQRELLFKKMKEAGYTFDFDKKELKKIEDEIEIPFGAKDSELQEATYYIPDGFHAEIDDDKVVIKKGEKSAAWSKDDEAMFQSCTGAIWAADYYLYEDKQDMEAWLKSLKNRIGG